jgi:hypothetical protein
VTVGYSTSDGTAHAGADYQAASGTLTFAPGQTRQTITIGLLDDGLVEGDETLQVTLSGATGGAVLGSPQAATLTIVDDDTASPPPPASIQWNVSSDAVDESQGSIILTVTRTGNTAGQVSVRVATSGGDAVPGVHYGAINQTLVFADGETSKNVVIPILDDGADDGNRSFSMFLSDPSTGAALGNLATIPITIRNTDQPAMVSMAGVSVVSDRHKRMTQLVIRFNGAVDPVEATRIATYRLATAGRGGSFDAKKGIKLTKLGSAAYDAASHSVTLTLAKPIKLKKAMQLRISGLGSSGLSDASGRLIDGNQDGQPGGDAIAIVARSGVSLSRIAAVRAMTPGAGFVDELLARDGLNEIVPRRHH